MSSQPPHKKSTRIHANIKLNRKLQFPTAHSTGKYKNTSVIRTIEAQMEQLNQQHHTLNTIQGNVFHSGTGDKSSLNRGSRYEITQRQGSSIEGSQERRFNLNLHSSVENSVKKSSEKLNLINNDYNLRIGQSLQLQNHQRQNMGSRGLMIPITLMNQQDALQQYQSIPMTRTRKEIAKQASNFQFQSFQRQNPVKMGGMGGHSSGNRKLVKSVERKMPLDNKHKLKLLNHSLISGNNSKLSNSYQLNLSGDKPRKLSGSNLNNSILSAINIYDSMQHSNDGSTETLRFKMKRNLFSQNNQYHGLNTLQTEGRVQSSESRKISLKSLQGRYNQHSKQLIKTNQPLEELRNAFNHVNNNSSKKHKNGNLLIEQNDSYLDGDLKPTLHDFASKKHQAKYQTLTNISQSTIGGYGSTSSRRLPLKHESFTKATTLDIDTTATTDTVMYLKQQELINNSQQMFEEGKNQLVNKDYKQAIKNFTNALKLNPAHKDSKYFRAIAYLDSDNPKKCIQDLNEIIQMDPYYNQTVYIVLSIAYRRENDLNNAVKALARGLQKFPKYVEAYLARGQLNIFMKKYEKALVDFQNVIKLQPQKGQGYMGQADSLKGMGNFKGALQAYNQAISTDLNCRDQGITKRGILQYQLKNYEQALADFTQLLESNDKDTRAHFYMGKILKNKHQQNEAILHFEQVIKNGQSGDEMLSGNALFEIAKIRIKQKDFYEAFHNLQRAVHYDFKSKKFVQYKMFVEGVLFIMKRRVKKGIKMLTSLIDGQITFDAKDALNSSSPLTIQPPKHSDSVDGKQDDNVLKNHLIYLIYTYRSYGYIVTEQLDKALSDLTKASKLRKLEPACVYNRFITQALVKMEKKDLNGVRQILAQAQAKFPMNKDPYKFQAICVVQEVINDVVDIDNPKKQQAMKEALDILNQALENNPKDSNLLYLRGLVLYYMHQFYEALIDLDAAIDIDEEPSAKLYLARGRCHACLSMFQEAINDLTKAIEMDEEISDAYFNRGKCAYLLGDTALAFLDFQKLILLEPKNPMVHIYAGNLLMTTGSYDDATKAFTNADSVQKSSLAFYQRARCFIALANMDQALKDLSLVVERSPSDKIAYVDRECLQAIKNAIVSSQSASGDVQKVQSPVSKSGNYDLSQFEKGAVIFTKLLNTYYDIENNTKTTTSANRMHQQIIPNVKRIKIEKMRALRRKRAKEAQFNQSKRHKKPKGRFQISDESDQQLRKQAQQIEPYSYYKENIFGQEDFYLYRGVMYFYAGEFEKAIGDYESSIKCKTEQKESEQSDGDTISNGSNQTDLSDVGLCSLNIHESSYNIVLCLILLKDYKAALDKLNGLIARVPKKYLKNLILIRGLLYGAVGNLAKQKQDFDSQSGNQNYVELIQNKNAVSLNPFPLGNRICSMFPEIKFIIPNPSQQTQYQFYSRPSFSFPFVKPPNMIPNVDESVLTSEFDLKNTSPPKPEAPWIKRCDYGIKFTDEIQVIDESTALASETEQSTMQQDKHGQDDSECEDQTSPYGHLQADQGPVNERYYLRAYVKDQRQKMIKAVSEQILKGEGFHFFREVDDERMQQIDDEVLNEEENTDEDYEDEEDGVGEMLGQHLYGGNVESGRKNIIVDDNEEEYLD